MVNLNFMAVRVQRSRSGSVVRCRTEKPEDPDSNPTLDVLLFLRLFLVQEYLLRLHHLTQAKMGTSSLGKVNLRWTIY